MSKSFILKGNFVYCNEKKQLMIYANSYGICADGVSRGIYNDIPEKFQNLEIIDYGDRLILPGLVDLHIHGPQYGFRGVGFDCELIEWLNKHTFPVESQFGNEDYAKKAYKIFVDDLKNSATTRAVIFGTIYEKSTRILMELLEETGIKTYVGKVNMDRNAPEYYVEDSTEKSVRDTIRFIEEAQKNFKNTKPIITPRFIPTCTDELMKDLADLKRKYHLPMQSHLSENKEEIEWVKELCPWAECYGDAYDSSGILEGKYSSILAHCVSSTNKEIELLREREVFVAHCPKSNLNLMSGIAPIRKYMEKEIPIGLGSDVAGGETLSIFEEMAKAIQVSKIYWRYIDDQCRPLTIPEVLFLATRGGGRFFGKVGSFEEEFEFDAIVIDDSQIKTQLNLTLAERLERIVYAPSQCKLIAKVVSGKKIFANS